MGVLRYKLAAGGRVELRAVPLARGLGPFEAEPINPRWDASPAAVSMPSVRQAMMDVISRARRSAR